MRRWHPREELLHPGSRCSPRLLPHALSSFSTAQPGVLCNLVPTLPLGRQPRPVLPTHTTLAPSGLRSGLARGLPTSQGIGCPGMQLIWLSPPCECRHRLLRGAGREPRAPSPLPQPSQVDHISSRAVGERAQRDAEPHAGVWGEPGHPLLVISREKRLRGGVCWDSRQAPRSQVLTEHFPPVMEPGGAQRCAKPVPAVPGSSCTRPGLVCAQEKGGFYVSIAPRRAGWPCRWKGMKGNACQVTSRD